MRKRRKRRNRSSGLISIIVLSLISILLFSFLFSFTNGFNEEFKSFYVEYDNQLILSQKTNVNFKTNSENTFYCRYLSDIVSTEKNDFSVKVLPINEENNSFDFTINGNPASTRGLGDLTQYFDIKQYDDYFTISFSNDFSVIGLIEKYYPEEDIFIDEALDISIPYFKLCISSYNEKIIYDVNFTVGAYPEKVEFNGEILI